ncbi:hypothetical protein IHC88_21335 (plasmid) [Photobacterium damselae subsp. damselae]|uniref:hypothetical protein n=1 Tax=Photobacterium damselae TaxID=38293 RepID=UPI001F3A6DF5|nr:hypothetical protein [Photobacterium damselae]UKA00525.1 hypothetical protein IHC88_21335 [Photobacterium damselae subsp. damselae]
MNNEKIYDFFIVLISVHPLTMIIPKIIEKIFKKNTSENINLLISNLIIIFIAVFFLVPLFTKIKDSL